MLVLLVKKLAVLLEAGLELGVLGGLGIPLLLSLEDLLFMSNSGLLPFLGKGCSFGGESFLDTPLDGVNGRGGMDLAILGLNVSSMNSGSVEPALADSSIQIGRRVGLGDLARDEGLGGSVKELVGEVGAASHVVHEVLVRGAEV